MEFPRHLKSLSDRDLNRLLKTGIALLAALGVAFGVVYYLGQRTPGGPSLAERTISSAEAAVRAQPNDIGTRLQLAAAYQLDGRTEDALAQYDEILEALPSDHTTLLARGDLLAAEGELERAIADYQKVIGSAKTGEFSGADTQLERAYLGLGTAQLLQGSPALAVASLEAALRINAADADAHYQLGLAQLKLGKPELAVSALRRALEFVPTGWCEPYDALGDAYGAMQQAPQAEYAGAMLDFCNDDAEGAAQRLTALLDGPESVDAMLGLGMIAARDNQRDEAIEWFSKVLEVDPDNVSAMYALSGMGATAPKPADATSSGAASHPTSGRRTG